MSETEISTVDEALQQLRELREQVQDKVPGRTSNSTGQRSIQDN